MSQILRPTTDDVAAHARARLEQVVAAHRAAGAIASVTVETGDVLGVILAAADQRHACPVALIRDLPTRAA